MSKDLDALIRLHKHRVDEKRRFLAELLDGIFNLEQQKEHLDNQILLEQKIAKNASEGVGMFYGAFAKEAVSKRDELLEQMATLERKIVEAKEQMRIEYKDLKVVEITQESRDQISAMEVSKTEQRILDELGQEAHRRRNV